MIIPDLSLSKDAEAMLNTAIRTKWIGNQSELDYVVRLYEVMNDLFPGSPETAMVWALQVKDEEMLIRVASGEAGEGVNMRQSVIDTAKSVLDEMQKRNYLVSPKN